MTRIGIDFGTTTTTAAIQPGGVQALLDVDVIPSVVAFLPSGRVDVGKNAKARRLLDTTNTIYSMKRILGRHATSPEVAEFERQYPFEFTRGADGMPRFATRAGKLSPVEVASYLFAHLRELLPSPLRSDCRDVRLTVPASFRREQYEAVLAAATRAGFSDLSLIDEPHAAALVHQDSLRPAQKVAVYDLGGGTFDFAVLEVGATGDFKVIASGGDSYLGGDDIDQCLAKWAADQILERYQWDVRSSARSYCALLFACERAKIRLSDNDWTAVPLGQIDTVLEGKDITMLRSTLEGLCYTLLQRTFVVCDDVCARVGTHPRQVDAVVLAGGGAYMPMVRQGVQHYFGKAPLVCDAPDRAVARGAALAKTPPKRTQTRFSEQSA